jgi:orotate phosphoribosyltransferase
MLKHELIEQLFAIGAVKFGKFTLKSGIESPFYIDLRLIISYPPLLKALSEQMWELSPSLTFDRICGVPYTALPIASYLCVEKQVPMLLKRKEAKKYGTKQLVEGVFSPNDKCLLLEDIVTSGKSIFETIEPLEELGLQITDILVLINREQGGESLITGRGYKLHSLFKITDILAHLEEAGLLSQEIALETRKFLQENQCSK